MALKTDGGWCQRNLEADKSSRFAGESLKKGNQTFFITGFPDPISVTLQQLSDIKTVTKADLFAQGKSASDK